MLFNKYPSIENSYRQKAIDYLYQTGLNAGEWVISEKIHGCLDENVEVETLEFGVLTIKKIVDEQIECHVKSFDPETNEIVFEKVIGFSVKENIDDWFEIELDDGKKIKVTASHYIWMPEIQAWRQVKDLKEGDFLLTD